MLFYLYCLSVFIFGCFNVANYTYLVYFELYNGEISFSSKICPSDTTFVMKYTRFLQIRSFIFMLCYYLEKR